MELRSRAEAKRRRGGKYHAGPPILKLFCRLNMIAEDWQLSG